ncbi:MAG: biotin/lipoyl-binding protein, partial [Phycisphaerales bacterium]|nr:biotin/lipoyl-binding protein [Phycisphaerales bacterium]
MKKVIIISIIAVVFIGGAVVLATVGLPQLGLNFLDGEKGTVTRGDMQVPITAVGTIESRKLIEIKFKASGVLTKIHTVEGAMVNEGDILAELDPIDEQRNVEAREAALARVTSLVEKAKITLEDLKVQLPLKTADAEQRVTDAAANLASAEFQFRKIEKLYGNGTGASASEQEFITTRSNYQRALAAKKIAELALNVARQNETVLIKQAEQDVAQASANVREARASLDDAKQRLSETTIFAPSNAMVYSILRK